MKRLKWPKIGATHPVNVYQAPERGQDETDDAFDKRRKEYELRADLTAHVRLMSRDIVRDWDQRYRKVLADEQARGGGYMSPEFVGAMVELNRETVTAACAALDGAEIGDESLSDAKMDAAHRTELIEGADLLGAVAQACRRGQSPTPVQLDSSGS